MQIEEVIKTLNQMQADGIMERYAIGGAVGATFYLEPVATLDVDIFIAFKPEAGNRLISLEPVFEYLKGRGFSSEREYVVISGWPVQFLPPPSPLAEEAVAQSVIKDVAGTPARVLTAEHLAAIALQTGRARDKARLLQFVEAGALDAVRFQEILERHGLQGAWEQFGRQFLQP